MKISISEINIVPIRQNKGLVAFASCVINKSFYLGNIAIHTNLSNGGFRIVFPKIKLKNGTQLPVFYPINKESARSISEEVIKEYENLMNIGVGNGKKTI